MKPFLALLLFMLCVPGLHADTGRIGTWNLGGFYQIPLDDLGHIAEGLKLLEADIIVLPELNPHSHGSWLVTALNSDPDRCYEAIVPDQPRARQEIAFLMRCEVEVLGSGMIFGSDLGKRGYRNAAYLHARIENFDFVLIGVHLKAGRGASNRALRTAQLEKIEAFAQGVVALGEKDVLVIGDYNMIPDEDEENFEALDVNGLKFEFPSSGLSGGSHISTSGGNTHVANLLDGLGFTAIDTPEYKAATISIVEDMPQRLGMTLSEYRENVTDHLPVMAIFETGTDHD